MLENFKYLEKENMNEVQKLVKEKEKIAINELQNKKNWKISLFFMKIFHFYLFQSY